MGLPNELIEFILLLLHPLTIVSCRRLCSYVKELIDNSMELELRIELALDGYLLNHKGDFTASELLSRERAITRAFETFEPTCSWKIDSANTRYDQYEICDGLWGRSTRRIRLEPFRAMDIVELVPPNWDGAQWHQHWNDLEMNVTDFSFDVSSDLLVLVEYYNDEASRRIHFRTISGNSPNPRASRPYFEVHQGDCAVWDSCLTLMYNDYVALNFAAYEQDWAHMRRRGGALVFNWRAGVPVTPYLDVSDLAFLSDDWAFVLFDGTGNSPVAFGICSLVTGEVTHKFELPLPHRRVYRARLLTHPGYGGASPATQARLVRPDPPLEIIVADFVLRFPRNESFLVVISIDLFLRKFESLKQQLPDKNAFSWEGWGPDVTRWLPSSQLTNSGFRSTFGSKMLVRSIRNPIATEDWGPIGNLILLDFNPRPILAGAKHEETERCRVVVHKGKTVWQSDHIPKPVESSLPFRAFIGKQVVNYEDVHLERSTMICRNEHTYTVLSFLPRDATGTKIDPE